MRVILAFLLVVLSVLTAVVKADIVVSGAYVREPVAGMSMTAGYMTLRNTGDKAVNVVAASSSKFGRIELHEHTHENGLMKMREVTQVSVPAGGQVAFQPGGLHLMLFASKTTVTTQDNVDITLELDDGRKITHQYGVKSLVK